MYMSMCVLTNIISACDMHITSIISITLQDIISTHYPPLIPAVYVYMTTLPVFVRSCFYTDEDLGLGQNVCTL